MDIPPPRATNGKPGWRREGAGWPNADASRFVRAGGIDWHVQIAGSGPVLLLLHGTGAATHSWRALLPLLASHFTVIAPDLPGHGFTSTPRDLTPRGMAGAVAALLTVLDMQPAMVAAHSAGAAIAVQMALAGQITPARIISFNGALLPWQGVAAKLFPPLAKLLVVNPVVPQLFAWRAGSNDKVARFLIKSTGSTIDAAGVDCYRRLFSCPGHAAGALGMMASWDLTALKAAMPGLKVPLDLVYGERDIAIPPACAHEVAGLVPGARALAMPGLGHLAHEEAPQAAVDLILAPGLRPIGRG